MGLLLNGWDGAGGINLKGQTFTSACADTHRAQPRECIWAEQWGSLTPQGSEGAAQSIPEQDHESEASGRKHLPGGGPRSKSRS